MRSGLLTGLLSLFLVGAAPPEARHVNMQRMSEVTRTSTKLHLQLFRMFRLLHLC